MKITKISYRALFNLGDYENEAIELFAVLKDDETPESVLPILREKCVSLGQPNSQENWAKRNRLYQEIKELELKVKQARSDWEATTEFLRTQGIKTDTPAFPTLQKLLPQVRSEEVEIVDAEIDNSPDESPF